MGKSMEDSGNIPGDLQMIQGDLWNILEDQGWEIQGDRERSGIGDLEG